MTASTEKDAPPLPRRPAPGPPDRAMASRASTTSLSETVPLPAQATQATPTQPAQATPTQAMQATTTPLAAQHERLMLELLPFSDTAQFRTWLAFLDGHWDEYVRDFLSTHPDSAEPDKTTTADRARAAIANRSVAFLAYHPRPGEKSAWTPEDHAVRFVATAIADSLLLQTWPARTWRKRPAEIARAVYEVLSYRRAGYYYAHAQVSAQPGPAQTDHVHQDSPPEYDSV